MSIANVYLPNAKIFGYLKQLLIDLKRNTESNMIIVGYFHTPLSSMKRSMRQKLNKEATELIYIMGQINLVYTYKIFHSKVAEYTFFTSS